MEEFPTSACSVVAIAQPNADVSKSSHFIIIGFVATSTTSQFEKKAALLLLQTSFGCPSAILARVCVALQLLSLYIEATPDQGFVTNRIWLSWPAVY